MGYIIRDAPDYLALILQELLSKAFLFGASFNAEERNAVKASEGTLTFREKQKA